MVSRSIEYRGHGRRSVWSALNSAPGECRLRFDTDGIVIERADPHVWLEDGFLQRLAGLDNPWVSLTYQSGDLCSPDQCCQRWRGGHCFMGAIVAIWGKNAHALYRIGLFRNGTWEAHRAEG